MKHKNGSGSSDLLDDHDKMVGYESSSSLSSSSSVSSSDRLEVNNGENDARFPESPSTTPKSSASMESGGTGWSLSPKQYPPIQVMGESYDPNRIPSSIFASKPSNDSEWSVASNESLFSINLGNHSFSMDSDYYITKSGKINWIDDGFEYCFTPDASTLTSPSPSMPTMTETISESERKSAGTNSGELEEKEELLETLNASPTHPESSPAWEGRQMFSPNSRVPDGTGASPTDGARNSDSSSQSTGSFAFPVLAGGSPGKEDAEKPEPPRPSTPPTPKAAAAAAETPSTTPKAGGNQWFTCFSCFPICC